MFFFSIFFIYLAQFSAHCSLYFVLVF